MPELAIEWKIGSGQSIIREFSGSVPLREVGFAYTRNNTKKRLLDLLADEITGSVPEEMLETARDQIVERR